MKTVKMHFSSPLLTLHWLCFFTTLISITNTRTSTLWKLNSDETKIVEASNPFINHPLESEAKAASYNKGQEEDPVFSIITSTVHYYGDTWMKEAASASDGNSCHRCEHNVNIASKPSDNVGNTSAEDQEELDCGKPVNFTYYDNLVGVMNRHRHPNVPEPQLALIFPRSSSKSGSSGSSDGSSHTLDLHALERRLRKARRDRPKSVQLYTQIGNLLRAQGDSRRAIECFRRALAVAPHHADALLSLARVLFALQYMDDAIYLTRRSLEVLQAGSATTTSASTSTTSQETAPSTPTTSTTTSTTTATSRAAWRHYFTLGEIFRAYGQYGKAQAHLRHALTLRPGFEPATAALRDIVLPAASVHVYTLLIIVCLVFGVLLVILSSVEVRECSGGGGGGVGVQRGGGGGGGRFNRGMAMHSLRGNGAGVARLTK